MGGFILKVVGYIFLRFIVFQSVLGLTSNDSKMVKLSDLQTGEDLFYILWIFLFFPVLEIIVLTIPFSYGLQKITESKSLWVIMLFLLLFGIEFLLAVLLTNYEISALKFYKIGISMMLFVMLFRKSLF